MPGVKINVRSTKFLTELQRRADAFRGRSVSAVLHVPPELKWWIYLEYGTAGMGIPGAATYPIDPHHPPEALHWFDGAGNPIFALHVDHPGIRPRAFVRKALPIIRSLGMRGVYAAMSSQGFNTSAIKQVLQTKIAPQVKATIVESLAHETKSSPREDPGAKLPGLTAAQAFENDMTVELRET